MRESVCLNKIVWTIVKNRKLSIFVIVFYFCSLFYYGYAFNPTVMDMYKSVSRELPKDAGYLLQLGVVEVMSIWVVFSILIFIKDKFFNKKISFVINCLVLVFGMFLCAAYPIYIDVFHIYGAPWDN